jgi:hypothetical protein
LYGQRYLKYLERKILRKWGGSDIFYLKSSVLRDLLQIIFANVANFLTFAAPLREINSENEKGNVLKKVKYLLEKS